MSARVADQIIGILAKLSWIVVFLFLMAPLAFVVIMSINPDPTAFPPHAISLVWYQSFLLRSAFRDGLGASLLLAVSVTPIAVVIGTSCAFPLARAKFRGRNALMAVFLSPISVPQIVSGVALLNFFVLIGIIPHTFEVLLIAHTIMALPYVIRVMTGSLVGFDRSLEEASLNLGANSIQTTTNVVFPLIKPGLLAASLFAFQASWSNLTVSVFLSSANLTPLPVVLFSWLRFNFDPALAAISTLLMILTMSMLFGLERILGLDRLIGVAGGLQSI